MRDDRTGPSRARGFTLTELLVVIAIIGILITFILVAASDGLRRAQEKATLALITKLEVGLSERLEATLLRRADVSAAHVDIASIWNGTVGQITSPQRSQVIAQIDLIKAEMPDVFFVQTLNSPLGSFYPLNFAALDYPAGQTGVPQYSGYYVPLGAAIPPNPVAGRPAPIGVFGATFPAAAGIYKNLGYSPAGYDGVDNNGDGRIDEFAEGIGSDPLVPDPSNSLNQIPLSSLIKLRLANHTHKTARAEMLYAILVEGVGPLGSVFTRDEFTNNEVKDTDGDNLPEFVDGWGEPLQFYRWPIYYNGDGSTGATASYVQKGRNTYLNVSEPRQTDPLDPGQSLVAPGWFSASANSAPPAYLASYSPGSVPYSAGASAFMAHFHSLLDPHYGDPGLTLGQLWDRSGFYPRRAFYSRFLILSGGPDKEPGVAQLGRDYHTLYSTTDGSGMPVPISTYNASTTSAQVDAGHLIRVENQAAAIDPNRLGLFQEKEQAPGTNQATYGLIQNGLDDVTNQGLASPGGGIR